MRSVPIRRRLKAGACGSCVSSGALRRRATRAGTRGSDASPSRPARYGTSSGLTGRSPASRRSSTVATPAAPETGTAGPSASRATTASGSPLGVDRVEASRSASSARGRSPYGAGPAAAARSAGGGGHQALDRQARGRPPRRHGLLVPREARASGLARRDGHPRRGPRWQRHEPPRPGRRALDRRATPPRRGPRRVRGPGPTESASDGPHATPGPPPRLSAACQRRRLPLDDGHVQQLLHAAAVQQRPSPSGRG